MIWRVYYRYGAKLLGEVEADTREQAVAIASGRWPDFIYSLDAFDRDFIEARLQRLEREIERDPRPTAYHEAGHAAVNRHFGIRILQITTRPEVCWWDGTYSPFPYCDRLGMVTLDRESHHPQTTEMAAEWIKTFLGGPAAEFRYRGRRAWKRLRTPDITESMGLIKKYIDGPEGPHLESFKARTEELVGRLWPGVEALASVLAERRDLDGEEAEAILDRGLRRRGAASPGVEVGAAARGSRGRRRTT